MPSSTHHYYGTMGEVSSKVLGGVTCTVENKCCELLVWTYKSNDLQYNKTFCEWVSSLVSIKSPIRIRTSLLPGLLAVLDVLKNQLGVTKALYQGLWTLCWSQLLEQPTVSPKC